MDKIIESLGKLNLDRLDKSWVEAVINDDYSTEKELPADFEMVFMDETGLSFCDTLVMIQDSIAEWLNDGDESDGSKTWQTLSSKSIDHKGLMAVLSTFFKLDMKELTDQESKLSALAASGLYFRMLSINGALVFKIFNSILYGQAVEQLRILNNFSNDGKNRQKRKERDDDDNEQDETEAISPEERQQLFSFTTSTILCLSDCIKNFQFKNEQESVIETIHVLVSIIKSERSTAGFLDTKPRKTDKAYLAYKSYELLYRLCNPTHGNVEATIRFILKSFLVEVNWVDNDLHASAKPKSVVRSHMLAFIKNLIEKFEDQTHQGIFAFIQQLCIQAPDKAEARDKAVQQIINILEFLPSHLFTKCVVWIISLSLADTVKNRVTALEIISKLLHGEEAESSERSESEDSEQLPYDVSCVANHRFLLTSVIDRISDISPTVRTKSLGILISLVTSNNSHMAEIIAELFDKNRHTNNKDFFNFCDYFERINMADRKFPLNPLPPADKMMELLEFLTNDSKVFVRKGSLNVILNVCKLNSDWISSKILGYFLVACRDNSVIVRKLMVQNITDLLLQFPENQELQKCWVNGVVPLISDNEVKSQEKVVEAVEKVILDNIESFRNTNSSLHFLPWKVAGIISSFGHRKYFRLICRQWAQSKRSIQELINVIKTHIGTENNLSAWFIIVTISEFQNLHSPNFIIEYFLSSIHNNSLDQYCSQLVVEAVHLNWRECKKDLVEELCIKIKGSVENFQVPFTLISRYFDIYTMKDTANAKDWAKSLITTSEEFIQKVFSSEPPLDEKLEIRAVQYLFTLGEALQICPDVISEKTKDTLIKIVDILSPEGEPPKKLRFSVLVTAVVTLTLGKICLQDQLVSKKIVPYIGALVKNTPIPVKINALIVLSDMCVRFTSLVEPYLVDFSLSLKDSELRVRDKTLALLTQLIQEDYIKIKSHIFFFVLSMMNDESSTIRKNTSMYLINTVFKKHPKIMYTEFIKAILFFNSCHDAFMYSGIELDPRELDLFCLLGPNNKKKRRNLYIFLLENLDDEHRFKLTCLLCTELLGKICEGRIDLKYINCQEVLSDTLYVLSSDKIKMSHVRGSKEDDDCGDFEDAGSSLKTKIMEKISKEVVKRTYIEHCIPVFIRLKRMLAELKSPLVNELMRTLKEILKDFKDNLEEMLAGDAELAAEIALDFQKADALPEPEEEENELDAVQNIIVDNVVNELIEPIDMLANNIINTSNHDIRDGSVLLEKVKSENVVHNPSVQPPSPSYVNNLPQIRVSDTAILDDPGTSIDQRENGRSISPSFCGVTNSTAVEHIKQSPS